MSRKKTLVSFAIQSWVSPARIERTPMYPTGVLVNTLPQVTQGSARLVSADFEPRATQCASESSSSLMPWPFAATRRPLKTPNTMGKIYGTWKGKGGGRSRGFLRPMRT